MMYWAIELSLVIDTKEQDMSKVEEPESKKPGFQGQITSLGTVDVCGCVFADRFPCRAAEEQFGRVAHRSVFPAA